MTKPSLSFLCLAIVLLAPATLPAHPMGNFSVSHFSRLQVTGGGVSLRYVLDLAEIPTFELLRTWKIERSASTQDIDEHAREQAREWLTHLSIVQRGRPLQVKLVSAKATIADGAGNLPILRVDMQAHIDSDGDSALNYEDENYPQRAGWKEIVITAGNGVSLLKVSQSNNDLSQALTHYPPDPTVAPPQDLRAEVSWKSVPKPQAIQQASLPASSATARSEAVATPALTAIPQPHIAPAAVAPSTLTAEGAAPGTVTRGDFLSRLLHQKKLSVSMILLALLAAFGLGAVHALTPGHGKAIVAAYLVGSRGTFKHAVFLGAMVTFTHTIAVFALGLTTLFLFRFIVPEKLTAILGALSGLSIVFIGGLMLYQRIRGRTHSHTHVHTNSEAPSHAHSHTHSHHHATDEGLLAPAHSHEHEHAHTHTHEHAHTHTHEHGHEHVHTHEHSHAGGHSHGSPLVHTHSHDGSGGHTHSHGLGTHTHSHVPEQLSWGGLVALGASGGLVPCESALVLLLGAIALGRVGFGLLLLVSFSLGLALVLMLIGVLVLYARNLLPERSHDERGGWLYWLTIASPAVVMAVGLLMTAASLGWIQSKWVL